MNLTKWEPTGLTSFRRQLDRLFDSFVGREPALFTNGDWLPALDVGETPEEIVVKVEVPGIDLNDISVSLSGNNLVIKGERKTEEKTKEKHFHRVERSYGTFERIVPVSVSIDENKIAAEYSKGMLEVHLPKKREAMSKPIKVEAK